MSEGIWLVLVKTIVPITLGAVVILELVVVPLISSVGALNFGFSCLFSFYEFGLVNNVLNPASSLANFLIGTPVMSPIPVSSVQSSCLQESNINVNTVSDLGTQVYSKASSCFGLLSGSDYSTGQSLLKSKDANFVFSCYYGKISTSNKNGDISNFSALINYIDKNYYNPQDSLQIAIITNGSDNTAAFPSLNQNITNNSSYSIDMFGYPGGALPSDCYSDFNSRCNYVSGFDQPSLSSSCTYPLKNNTKVINSLTSSQLDLNSNPPYNSCSGNYTISFCGHLLNAMVLSQDRVFVCITLG
ncbi:hypothetical protein IHE51_01055 [Candidatus Parvarchaeota archaeon]|uniref:Uncharacterized protein n=1 Tax=Candidatus Acidifodinimicrobium mancum TaxID=2898728 RepID=A0A8T3URY8_9ARCH|nr:hypothetical protein [Candidatus Acidifodinimicrobium mancum]MBE5730249.1 hypothetical protein [Candidatus Acidifodinimicrobium mancum]